MCPKYEVSALYVKHFSHTEAYNYNLFNIPLFQKPVRECPFCGKAITGGKLKRHIANVQKNEDEVSANLTGKKLDKKFLIEKTGRDKTL